MIIFDELWLFDDLHGGQVMCFEKNIGSSLYNIRCIGGYQCSFVSDVLF